jgi:cytochrome P450
VFNGNEPVLTIADPELIKLVLVKDFNKFTNRKELKTEHHIINNTLFFSRGEQWKRIRSIISPTFTSGKMKKMYSMIRHCLQEFLDHLETFAKEGKDINLKNMHGNFTMDVIASCAFATKTNAHKDPNNPFFLNGKKIFDFKAIRVIPALLFPKFLNNILNVKSFFDESANQFFFNLTRHILKTRRNDNTKHDDFIQLLINAEQSKEIIRDENDVNEAHHVNEGKKYQHFILRYHIL